MMGKCLYGNNGYFPPVQIAQDNSFLQAPCLPLKEMGIINSAYAFK